MFSVNEMPGSMQLPYASIPTQIYTETVIIISPDRSVIDGLIYSFNESIIEETKGPD